MAYKINTRIAATITSSIGGMIDDDIVDDVAYDRTEYLLEAYLVRLGLSKRDGVIDFESADIELLRDNYYYDAITQTHVTDFTVCMMADVVIDFRDKTHLNKIKLMFPDFSDGINRGEIEIEN